MKELKITQGEWHVVKGGNTMSAIYLYPKEDMYEYNGNNGRGIAGARPLATVTKAWYEDGEEGYNFEDNAKLIADAGNTYQKCGMTPSELLANLEESQSSVSMLSATVKRLETEKRELLAKYKEAVEALEETTLNMRKSTIAEIEIANKNEQIINQSKED